MEKVLKDKILDYVKDYTTSTRETKNGLFIYGITKYKEQKNILDKKVWTYISNLENDFNDLVFGLDIFIEENKYAKEMGL